MIRRLADAIEAQQRGAYIKQAEVADKTADAEVVTAEAQAAQAGLQAEGIQPGGAPLAFPQKVRRRVRQHRRHNAFRTRHQNRHSHREPDPG